MVAGYRTGEMKCESFSIISLTTQLGESGHGARRPESRPGGLSFLDTFPSRKNPASMRNDMTTIMMKIVLIMGLLKKAASLRQGYG